MAGKQPSFTHLARFMALLAAMGAAGELLAPALLFIVPSSGFGLASRFDGAGAAEIAAAPLEHRLIALGCVAIPAVLMVIALASLARLFLRYANGEVFSGAALRLLNRVALALFASTLADIVMRAPLTLALSWHRGPGHRAISLGLGSDQIGALFLAGSILVIARVMAEARRLADENAGFV